MLGGRRVAVAGSALAAAPFWLGSSFDGLPLVHEEPRFAIYGECSPAPCAPPLEVQRASTCGRNVAALDVVPGRVVRVRGGGIAAFYGPKQVDLGTGRSTVTIFTRGERVTLKALRAVRRRSQTEPRRLPAPRYPLAVRRELARVVEARERLGGVKEIASELELAPGHVRGRLRLARLLPEAALRGVRPPRRTWSESSRTARSRSRPRAACGRRWSATGSPAARSCVSCAA